MFWEFLFVLFLNSWRLLGRIILIVEFILEEAFSIHMADLFASFCGQFGGVGGEKRLEGLGVKYFCGAVFIAYEEPLGVLRVDCQVVDLPSVLSFDHVVVFRHPLLVFKLASFDALVVIYCVKDVFLRL